MVVLLLDTFEPKDRPLESSTGMSVPHASGVDRSSQQDQAEIRMLGVLQVHFFFNLEPSFPLEDLFL